MSYKNHQSKKDSNHVSIVRTLQSAGRNVIDTSGLGGGWGDVISDYKRACVLIEIKTSDGELALSQMLRLATWSGYAVMVQTDMEAIKATARPDEFCLTDEDKKIIFQIYQVWSAKSTAKYPRISVSAFEKEFARRKYEKA